MSPLRGDTFLDLLTRLQGKWMLTMYSYDKVYAHATKYGWTILRITRTISTSKSNHRKQEEWLVTNY